MFNVTELLGQILQSGISRSTTRRLRYAIGAQGAGQPGGAPGEAFGRLTGQDDGSGGMFGGLAEPAPEFVGADRSGQGALALLSGLALSALGTSPRAADAEQMAGEAPPLRWRAPQDATETQELEHSATLILAAMINAAKADGQVDQEELQRIVGKLREAGAQAEALDFVMSELKKPMDLDGLIRRVPSEQVAVQLYAASLLAIEMDTEAERRYLRRLAHGLKLEPSVVQRVHQCLGMDHA